MWVVWAVWVLPPLVFLWGECAAKPPRLAKPRARAVESVARLFLRRDVAAKPVVFRVLWWRGLGSRPWAYNAALECLGQFATYKLADGLVQPVEFGLYHFPCLGEYARAGIGQPVT